MGIADDTLFELKIVIDRAIATAFRGNKKPRRCPNCGTENRDEAVLCKNCLRMLPKVQ